jgi:ATP-dependent Clp protease adaptor protein ClpS
MLVVHETGKGVAGVYTRDVAETKVSEVHALAKEYGMPLRLDVEPDDDA